MQKLLHHKSSVILFVTWHNVSAHCRRFGLDNENPVVFTSLFSQNAAEKIRTHTTEQLVKDGRDPISSTVELYQFVGTMLILSRLRLSASKVYVEYVPTIEQKYKIKLMKEKRFTEILHRLRGYDVGRRTGDDMDDVWLQKKNRLRQLEELETLMFAPSVSILMNKKSGELVLDDELIGSRAQDVESKNHSERKAGRDGPCADAIACSHLGILFGMRLRLSDDSSMENVVKLFERLPDIKSLDQDVAIKFDRGYGKQKTLFTVGAKGYKMGTIACERGSQHPYIPWEDANVFREKLTTQEESPEHTAKLALLDSVQDFILDGTELSGAQVTYATKTMTMELTDGTSRATTIHAFSIRDVFDKKTTVKDLRFFSTAGNLNDDTFATWVAISKDERIHGNYLFSDTKPSALRSSVESKLSLNCQPLTIGQRCADWFLLRRFRFTGTMGASIQMEEEQLSQDNKKRIMEQCINSWFRRHKSTEEMKQGSLNEPYIIQRMRREDWILDIFEVGMLQSMRGGAWLAVSPDAILIGHISSPDGLFQEENDQVMFVEMKTRQSEERIANAIATMETHGRLVYCNYDDNVFKSCVLYENRKQLLHQAMITNLKYGVFVTAIASEGTAQIVQLVVIRFSDEFRDNHFQQLNTVGQELLGWLYEDTKINRGYLMEEDCPSFMNDEEKSIFISHYPMWCALHCKVAGDTDNAPFKPLRPVAVIKHFQQYNYNKSKWGLDKNTEAADKVGIEGTKLCFESVYIIRDINAIVVSTWRVAQSREIRPWIVEFARQNNGIEPSTQQIRNKLSNMGLPLKDFVHDLGVDLLKYLGSTSYARANLLLPSTVGMIRRGQDTGMQLMGDADLNQSIALLERKGKWPLRTHRLQKFLKLKELQKLRKHRSQSYHHSISKLPLTSTGKLCQLKCSLCSKAKGKYHQTTKECATCKVPLCCK